jgi:hypothetical protein
MITFSSRPKEHCPQVFKWILICCTIPASLSYIPYWESITFSNGIAIIVTLVLLTACYLLFKHSPDPYGLFHLDMNTLPGANTTLISRTEWLNMGYWKVLVKSCLCFGPRLRIDVGCRCVP